MKTTKDWLDVVLAYLTTDGSRESFEAAAGAFIKEVMRKSKAEFSYGLAGLTSMTLMALKNGDAETWGLFLTQHVTYSHPRFAEVSAMAPGRSPATKHLDDLVMRSRPSVAPVARPRLRITA